jgi:hypothetical protein
VTVQVTAKHQQHITDRVQDILRFVSEAGVNDGGYCYYLLSAWVFFFPFFFVLRSSVYVSCPHLGVPTAAGKTRW